jgi:hypothetical protein
MFCRETWCESALIQILLRNRSRNCVTVCVLSLLDLFYGLKSFNESRRRNSTYNVCLCPGS